jgi:nicotinate-nucleotide pyrophosphorylase (carboxylating)
MTWACNKIDHKLIDLALEEDLRTPFFDATTQALFDKDSRNHQVEIVSKESVPIVFAGLPVVSSVLSRFGDDFELHADCNEGDLVMPQQRILTIKGSAKQLLMAERTILNFLRHLCAVATLTHHYVEKIKGTSMKILDTRKTAPGWRHLEKYAVYCGGGVNHRMGLYDAIMVKDTHIDLMGGMQKVMEALPTRHEIHVIIEVRNLEELDVVIEYGRDKVDRVLLDNMTPEVLSECVKRCQGIFITEASGDITLDSVLSVAQTGVAFASVGKITHSAGSVDLSMRALAEA